MWRRLMFPFYVKTKELPVASSNAHSSIKPTILDMELKVY